MNKIQEVLSHLLEKYSTAKGAMFFSMDLPTEESVGEHTDFLELYKDIPMMSVDENFKTTFNYINTEKGSIVIFFVNNLHFVSIFVDEQNPNKALATRTFESIKPSLELAIASLYE
ncbi:MAG: hypothetical protein ACI83W_000127 [Marinoscillum sp.]|jgi:hypothetical protein